MKGKQDRIQVDAPTMAMHGIHNTLQIRVVEESAASGVFVVSILCGEPLLLHFWVRKPAFRNGQVEQTHVTPKTAAEVTFVLRVTHRAPNLPNCHYWSPFVLALCLDALYYRFRLPAHIQCVLHIQEILQARGELTLTR